MLPTAIQGQISNCCCPSIASTAVRTGMNKFRGVQQACSATGLRCFSRYKHKIDCTLCLLIPLTGFFFWLNDLGTARPVGRVTFLASAKDYARILISCTPYGLVYFLEEHFFSYANG